MQEEDEEEVLEEEDDDSEAEDEDQEQEDKRRGSDRVDMAIQTTFLETPSPSPALPSGPRFRGQKVSPAPAAAASPYFRSPHLRSVFYKDTKA
jgi:hypothetical protein